MDPDNLAKEPEMKYMPRETIEAWMKSKKDLIGGGDYNPDQWERFNRIRYALIKSLHDRGYGLLLGYGGRKSLYPCEQAWTNQPET